LLQHRSNIRSQFQKNNIIKMKKLLTLFAMVAFLATSTFAQIQTPAASPAGKVVQTVGLSDVTVEYSRPSMKGRTIFGADALVPNGKFWRTGANAATKITFSDDVMIEGSKVEAGSYAILSTPGDKMWTINFYPYESGNWGSYVEKTPSAVVGVKVMESGMKMETFTILFDELTSNSAVMKMLWSNAVVPVKLSVEVDEKVMKNIESVMAGPSANDYYAAASYYHSEGKDLNKALEWINKATEGPEKRFWQVKRKSEILADLGKYKEAIKSAELSRNLAQEAGNDDYVKMNTDNINKWSKM